MNDDLLLQINPPHERVWWQERFTQETCYFGHVYLVTPYAPLLEGGL